MKCEIERMEIKDTFYLFTFLKRRVVVKRGIGNLFKCVLHGCPETDESVGRSISCDLSHYF